MSEESEVVPAEKRRVRIIVDSKDVENDLDTVLGHARDSIEEFNLDIHIDVAPELMDITKCKECDGVGYFPVNDSVVADACLNCNGGGFEGMP